MRAIDGEEIPCSVLKKANLGKRTVAFALDAVIGLTFLVIPSIGSLIGAAYMLLRDGLSWKGHGFGSIGKKAMNLLVVIEGWSDSSRKRSVPGARVVRIALVLSIILSVLMAVIPRLAGSIYAKPSSEGIILVLLDCALLLFVWFLAVKLVLASPEAGWASIRRNWMFAAGPVICILMFVPILGWIAAFLLGLVASALGIIEIVKVFTDPRGKRIGDNIAGTIVLEEKA